MEQQNRQLAAILFTDIVGYTAMMQKDEQNALAVTRHYIATLKQSAETFHGRILNDYGDGSLCSFPSATEAVKAAVQIQQQLQEEPKVPLRIGIHVGELFFEENKVMGDSVNVASRIQSLACANSILFSKEVFDKLKNQPDCRSVSLGRFEFKNVDEPLEIFALANEGLVVPKREQLSGKLKEIRKISLRKKWMTATFAVALLVAGVFVYKRITNKGGFNGEKSIAVLPFDDKGMDSTEEYIVDGISQDIINSLSRISSLKKVIGWISVKSFKKTSKPIKTIANELGVAAILSGTIKKEGGKIHIVAELVEASTNRQLWSDDFEYDSNDFFHLVSKSAEQIVNALHAKLTKEENIELSKQSNVNPEAYKLYKKGLYFFNKGTQQAFDSAEACYKRALDLDPDYALAYSGLADCYIYSRKISSQLEGIPVAKMYALKALSLDTNLSEALTTLGFTQGVFDYDWVKSKVTLEAAIRSNPNYPVAHLYYGNLLQYTGENTTKGIMEIKRALELNPLDPRFNWVLGRNYYLSRQDNLALQQLKKTLLLDPDFVAAKYTLALLYIRMKLFPEALKLIQQLPKIPTTNLPSQGQYLAYALAISGDISNAKKELARSLKDEPRGHLGLAYTFVALNDHSEALKHLEKAYEERELALYWVKIDPILDPIRNEPRFKALLKKMNLQ